jgi:hypothetical protein
MNHVVPVIRSDAERSDDHCVSAEIDSRRPWQIVRHLAALVGRDQSGAERTPFVPGSNSSKQGNVRAAESRVNLKNFERDGRIARERRADGRSAKRPATQEEQYATKAHKKTRWNEWNVLK